MIGSISGKVVLKTEKFVILEAAGVGYKVYASPDVLSTLPHQAEEASLWVYTHVREDAIDLYGFKEREEQEFFEMLLGVSGIGPKGAISILGIAPLSTLRQAIGSGDTAYLTKVSGIGRKTAEKIIIELRDKIGEIGGGTLQGELDVLEALKSLGYGEREVRDVLKKLNSTGDTNAKIKEALKILGGK